MALPWMPPLPAAMTMLTETFGQMRNPCPSTTSGFTLVEVLITSFIAGLLSITTATLMIENNHSNARAETRRRLHEDWNRTTHLIQSEIAMSHSIETSDLSPYNVTDDCSLLQDPETRLKLRMHLIGTLPDVLYGVRTIRSLPAAEANQWMGGPDGGVLVRCGPRLNISKDGRSDYIQGTPYQQSVILDNLDLANGDGLDIIGNPHSQKLVEFQLAMQGDLGKKRSRPAKTLTRSSGGLSRINEVVPIPTEKSVCESICREEGINCGHGVTTLLSSDPRNYTAPEETEPVFGTATICTNRSLHLGDRINGANGNYVIDGNPTPDQSSENGIQLIGGEGKNILLGTPRNDTLRGGPQHDALIGRGGSDNLRGEAGDDSLVPLTSASNTSTTTTVDGGEGFDRVYLQGPQSDYNATGCHINRCTLRTDNGASIQLFNIELLVFKDSTRRLSE